MATASNPAHDRVEFTLIIDEHGTIGSDKDSDPYGDGFVIAQKGEELDAVSQSIRKESPNGFHLKTGRGTDGKLRKAKRLISLLPTQGHFYCGGYIQMNPAYAREKAFNMVAGRGRLSEIPPQGLMDLVQKAPVKSSGLISPYEVVPKAVDVGRLITVYTHALRVPVMIALHAVMPVSQIKIDVRIGIVRDGAKFREQMQRIDSHLTNELPGSLQKLIAASKLPRPPDGHLDVSFDVSLVGANHDPLFGVADLFAGIALHYDRSRKRSDYSLGHSLYEEARHILTRSPWQLKASLIPGIIEMKHA